MTRRMERGARRSAIRWLPLLLSGLLGSVSATGVGMSNTWVELNMSRARCVQQATLAIKKAGFTENFEAGRESVFGDQEDYTVLFRCLADKKVAFIVVAGPDSDLADHYVSDVEAAFSAGNK